MWKQGRQFHLVQSVSTDISVWCMYSSQQLIVTSLLEPTWETHLLALQVWGVVVQRLQCQSSSERTRACVHMKLSRDMANFFHLTNCLCHLEETLKVVGPIYQVSRPGEVKDPTLDI